MPLITVGGYTMKALLERAAITTGDRRVSYSWIGQLDALGKSQGVRLTFDHNKSAKRYEATFYRYERQQRDGFAMEMHVVDFGAGSSSRRVASQACARFSASSFASFQAATIDLLTSDPDDAFRFIAEAASLTMAEVTE